ncbi:N-carbamoyl-D-amino acid hydrolase [Teratosphaeria destructans]|uniref:N-carbamoyl-D-amino acid hydrolase n=1 Tax=Teratosphaeria destructans TaxID=418781 RepID=A0A9W7W0T0_9PEZI|nr:N-carbamoyl-D-amino acid hydrolase [Teratosphaeria destructans]
MSRRILKVAAAQVGAIDRQTPKQDVVTRLIRLLHAAAEQRVQLVVFPECTLTTFFPRHLFTSQEELDTFFEHGDVTASPDVEPLFHEARAHGIDITLGYAERTPAGTGYNTSVYYSAREARVLSKYRKVHLPGTEEPFEDPQAPSASRPPPRRRQAATATDGERTTGRGDPIMGLMICNDRRWPEAWRQYGLQGAELLMCGYNTGGNMAHLWGSKPMSPEEAQREALFHSRLVQQANSYMNACFSISSARCGLDDGRYDLIGGSAIVSPEGHVVAEAKTTEDELVVAEIDLAECRQGKEKTFDFDRHRRIEAYGLINTQTGVVEPPLL